MNHRPCECHQQPDTRSPRPLKCEIEAQAYEPDQTRSDSPRDETTAEDEQGV